MPVEHAYFLGRALAAHGVPLALHVFQKRRHGLGLAEGAAGGSALLKQQLDAQLSGLDSKESNLPDLAADGTLPQQKIRAKLREIASERERLTEQLHHVSENLADAVRFVEANLALLENTYELYLNASD